MKFSELQTLFPDAERRNWHKHANGGGWVENTAQVAKTAFVGPEAQVYGTASVSGLVRISGNAIVFGAAAVCDDARVAGEAQVYGKASVSDRVRIFGNAIVGGFANVSGSVRISGTACVDGQSYISGDAVVRGTARLTGDAVVEGDAYICEGEFSRRVVFVSNTPYSFTECSDGQIRSGCLKHSVSWWQESVVKCAREHGYDPVKTKLAKLSVNYIAAAMRMLNKKKVVKSCPKKRKRRSS